MNTRRTIVGFAGAVLLTVTASLAQQVKTDYDRGTDFGRFRRYSWEKVQTRDQLWVERIKQAVNSALAAKGWTLVDSGGDVAVIAIAPAQADGTLVPLPLPGNVMSIEVFASDTVGENCLLACDWQPFAVEYAGPAPYLVAGASQINFQAANYPGAIYVILPSGLSQGFQIYVAGQ